MSKTYIRYDSSSDQGEIRLMQFSLIKEDKAIWRIKLVSVSSDEMQSLMNPHLSQFGKMCYETGSTGYICPICNLEIDEFGLCGCGTGSG
ncbi:MAG: hypothetical protein QXD10_08765 [Metallosphaera sp.]|uniref:hypothetical protein n=1 Tax=Metallosphaera sp. TaxID=2020860 RepID=UPI0031660B27